MKYYSFIAIALLTLWTGQSKAQTQVDYFNFSKDYFPGSTDANGKLYGGTELMMFRAYDGKLFASTSVFRDSFQLNPYPNFPGGQIIRKDCYNCPWVVDTSWGKDFVRVDALYDFEFTKDSLGNALNQPVKLLVAGLYDSRYIGQKNLSVAVRNDSTGKWIRSIIVPADTIGFNENFTSVGAMIRYDDKITGKQYLMVTASFGAVYKAVYDPSSPAKLKWNTSPEFYGTARPLSFTVANDTLYCATGLQNQKVFKGGGILRRNDGFNPSWTIVHTWALTGPGEHLMRGLSTVPNTNSSGPDNLIGCLESPPLPIIRRVEPWNNYKYIDELNYVSYFTQVFGAPPSNPIVVGGAAVRFEKVKIPSEIDSLWLIGVSLTHPNYPNPGYGGAYYLVRDKYANYRWGKVLDTNNLEPLFGIRDIIVSPFPEEKNSVWYFGGFYADADFYKNSAWIYKGVLKNTTGINDHEFYPNIKIFPNPTNELISVSGFDNAFTGFISIYNTSGQILVKEHKAGSQFNIEIGHLKSGIYIVQIKNENGEVITRKFIKK